MRCRFCCRCNAGVKILAADQVANKYWQLHRQGCNQYNGWRYLPLQLSYSRAGQGRAGQDDTGQGREGQGRAGQAGTGQEGTGQGSKEERKTPMGQECTCLGMSRTFRVDMRSGRTGGSSGLSPTRIISLTERRGQLPCRVTQECFIILLSVMRSLGF